MGSCLPSDKCTCCAYIVSRKYMFKTCGVSAVILSSNDKKGHYSSELFHFFFISLLFQAFVCKIQFHNSDVTFLDLRINNTGFLLLSKTKLVKFQSHLPLVSFWNLNTSVVSKKNMTIQYFASESVGIKCRCTMNNIWSSRQYVKTRDHLEIRLKLNI